MIKRKTATDRLRRSLRQIHVWCKRNRHRPIREQHEALCRKIRGHYAYYGITGNARSLQRFRTEVARVWGRWLNTRSRGKRLSWEQFSQQLREVLPLPRVRIVHSIFAANP